MTKFYDHTTYPSTGSNGSSEALRAELDLIEAGFDSVETLKANKSDVDFATNTHALTSKATPVDADELALLDSAASFVATKLTFANLKTVIKNYLSNIAFPIGETTPSTVKATTINASGLVSANAGLSVTGDLSSQLVRGKQSTYESAVGIALKGTANNAYGSFSVYGATGDTYWSIGKAGATDALTFYSGDVTTGIATECMRLDAAGNLGLGVTPSAWNIGWDVLELPGGSFSTGSGNAIGVQQNLYVNAGGSYIYKVSNPATVYQQFLGSHQFYSASSGVAGNVATLTQVLNIQKDYSVALQGSTSQAGTGITFPATQNPSSDPNTLDDYEEGTWTPTLFLTTPGTSSFGYVYRNGFYTKVGDIVTIQIEIVLNSFTLGTGSGLLSIGGLPFTAKSTAAGGGSAASFSSAWVGLTANTGFVTTASTSMGLYNVSPSGNASNIGAANIGSNSAFYLTTTYKV